MSGFDVLAVLDAAHATFDNLRYERRNNAYALQQSMHWTLRIEEMIKTRAAIAELIEAAKDALDDMHDDDGKEKRRLIAALAAVSAK